MGPTSVDTKALIVAAKKASNESYVARFRALNIAGWAYLLRQKSAELRQVGKKRRSQIELPPELP